MIVVSPSLVLTGYPGGVQDKHLSLVLSTLMPGSRILATEQRNPVMKIENAKLRLKNISSISISSVLIPLGFLQ
jgi:hypothetical protein